jgi:hypothetical protein
MLRMKASAHGLVLSVVEVCVRRMSIERQEWWCRRKNFIKKVAQ